MVGLDTTAAGVAGALSGFVASFTVQRIRQARTDTRLTWLEDAQGATLRGMIAMCDYLNASDERKELVRVLSQAPRVRG